MSDDQLCETCSINSAEVVWLKDGGRVGIKYLCDHCSSSFGFSLIADGWQCLETPAGDYAKIMEYTDSAFQAAEDLAAETDCFDGLELPTSENRRTVHFDEGVVFIFDLHQKFFLPEIGTGEGEDYRIIGATMYDVKSPTGNYRSLLLVDEDNHLCAVIHPNNLGEFKLAAKILSTGAIRNL